MRAAFPEIIRVFSPFYTNHSIDPVFIILHCIGYNDPLEVLNDTQTSAHYLIPVQNNSDVSFVYEVVPPPLEAWHAGISHWQDYSSLNRYAYGIELSMPNYAHALDNNTHLNFFYFETFQKAQILALVPIIKMLKAAYPSIRFVLGHSDIAPWRNISGEIVLAKTDPGPTTPWAELAAQGIGIWPKETACPTESTSDLTAAHAQELLTRIGYFIPLTGIFDHATNYTLGAFRLHWAPGCFDSSSGLATACYEKEFDAGDACRLYQIAEAFKETSFDSTPPTWAIVTSIVTPLLCVAAITLLYKRCPKKHKQEDLPTLGLAGRSNSSTRLQGLFACCSKRRNYQQINHHPQTNSPRIPKHQQHRGNKQQSSYQAQARRA